MASRTNFQTIAASLVLALMMVVGAPMLYREWWFIAISAFGLAYLGFLVLLRPKGQIGFVLGPTVIACCAALAPFVASIGLGLVGGFFPAVLELLRTDALSSEALLAFARYALLRTLIFGLVTTLVFAVLKFRRKGEILTLVTAQFFVSLAAVYVGFEVYSADHSVSVSSDDPGRDALMGAATSALIGVWPLALFLCLLIVTAAGMKLLYHPRSGADL